MHVQPPAGPAAIPGAADRHAVRVLALLTRDVGGRATGRINVLRTHLRALTALGHHVEIAVVSPSAPATTDWSERFPTHHVRSPRPWSVARSSLAALTTGDLSLNEGLFVDGSVRAAVAALVRTQQPDVVVVDSLRLSTAVRDVQVPVVVDLDDLLSDRYERLRTTARQDPVAVLGFAADRIPTSVRRPAARAATSLLGWEARRVARREAEVTLRADAVSLVSDTEAAELSRRSARPVTWLPPSVDVPAESVTPADGLCFLGGLDYLPNVQALRWYRDEVLPHLDPTDPRLVLHVVGTCPQEVRAELTRPGIEVHGFVADLHQALSRRLLIAPLEAGGVKLKVLDAMAHGLAVAGLPGAFDGTGLPAELRLEATDGPGLARLVRELVGEPDRCATVGGQVREYASKTFSLNAAADRWAALLDQVVLPHPAA